MVPREFVQMLKRYQEERRRAVKVLGEIDIESES
jgi:hypothetical protein